MGSWTEEDPRIASSRLHMTEAFASPDHRGGGALRAQCLSRWRRNSAVIGTPSMTPSWATGQALPQDPNRFGVVSALGLDEVAFLREAPYYRTQFSTSIVDVGRAQLLDVVPGRSGKEPIAWLQAQGHEWLSHVRYATLDFSGPYRAVFTNVLPGAILMADPFQVVKLANTTLDECRRRVQNELLAPPRVKA